MGDFGDISDRNGIVVSTRLLADAKENIILPRWAQQRDLPKNRGRVITFRRYNNLKTALAPILGSTTPSPNELTFEDIVAQIEQFGSWLPVSERIRDTHEDPILQESQRVSSFQQTLTVETLTYNVIKGGTQAVLANDVSLRSDIEDVISIKEIRAAVRNLQGKDARPFTQLITSTPDFNTIGIEPAFFGYTHTALIPSFRKLSTFVPVNEYTTRVTPMPGEFGTVENVRFIASNVADPFVGAGKNGSANDVIIDTVTNNVNVYPTIIFATDAFATSKLAGMDVSRMIVHNPKTDSNDPLMQRGSVGWILWYTALILNNNFMTRIETAAASDAGL